MGRCNLVKMLKPERYFVIYILDKVNDRVTIAIYAKLSWMFPSSVVTFSIERTVPSSTDHLERIVAVLNLNRDCLFYSGECP